MFLPGATQTNKFLPTSRAALLLVFSPTCPAGTSHPSPSQSYLPDCRTHSAPHHIAETPTTQPSLHSPTPASQPSLPPPITPQLPPPPLPLLPQNGWGGGPLWSSFLAMPFTKPGLACGHLVTRETCTRCARRFSQRWSGWNACALARSSNIRCQVRVLMVIRDMAVAGKPGASCTSKLG